MPPGISEVSGVFLSLGKPLEEGICPCPSAINLRNRVKNSWEKSCCGFAEISWPSSRSREEYKEESRGGKRKVVPEGCFSVYVGPQKQRFVIKTENANHPLFQILLEEAASEYGYNNEGPLELPCDVDLFVKVLVEMDSSDEIGQGLGLVMTRIGFSAQLG
ncbi:hypothetical protein RHSIM_Rhsim12G0096300 [Rhododendron simsii]|uniref:Uncharacterized protein n=1 Tax=Rhododendron simsii TaxID=118357 RepID=A0A834G6T7_RHOSS|nr:hypothetical protein RHSIM_Rhsim12G0096300 [Rhododendron simsii]